MRYAFNNGASTRRDTSLLATIVGIVLAGFIAIAGLIQPAAAAPSPVVVYDALASVTPTTNYPSQPFQAQQTSEFGDYVHLAGTARQLDSIKLTMSNWAKADTAANVAWCAANPLSCDADGYTVPITVNLYADALDANDVPTTLLGSKVVDVHVPWRPASDPSCAPTSNGTGWLEGGNCVNFSGIAFNADFDLASLNLVLPDDVIVGFGYNTQTYGEAPTGVDGPYNSLNIAIPENNTATIGSDVSADSTFWNTLTQSYYSNANCVAGTFCMDTNWTPYGTVPMQISATTAANVPVDKDQCKKNGWMNFTDANGNAFKNQGQCVSSVASKKIQ